MNSLDSTHLFSFIHSNLIILSFHIGLKYDFEIMACMLFVYAGIN